MKKGIDIPVKKMPEAPSSSSRSGSPITVSIKDIEVMIIKNG